MMKNFKITTTSICYVEAETEEEAIEEFENSICDYGDAECCEIVEEVSDEWNRKDRLHLWSN